MIQDLLKKWGKHVGAFVVFLALTITYFSPAVLDGKMIRQGDMEKVAGMGASQMDEYAQTAQPGEFSVWSDAMFGGMPYGQGYGNPAPNLPGYTYLDMPIKKLGYLDASMVLAGLISFYILMCVLGVNWWLAIAGSIAFAFASYNLVIIEAGHITKAYVIAYMPITLAGMALLFRKSYLWGAVLFLLGVTLSIGNGHIQITYYLVLLCLFIYAGYVVWKIKQKELDELAKVTAVMVGCVILAILPNAGSMYSHWDLGQHSLRGPTELTTTTPSGEKISSGLDKDYAFAWSYGRGELFTLLIPNAYGGESGGTLDENSELYKELKSKGAQVSNKIQTYTYWGEKSFTQGTVYFGALVCFLFVFGMFVIRNSMKWWLFAGGVFLTFLALGRNFDSFNTFIFHYLPLYNKFRTVEMALVIPGLVVPLVAIWGLKELFSDKVNEALFKKGLYAALGITGGLCLIVWLAPSLFLSFQSSYDAHYQLPDWYYNALLKDRESLASSDAFRSLLFVLAGAALLFGYSKMKNKTTAVTYVSAAIAVLILVDLWPVDKRFLNESNFTRQKPHETYQATVADNEILKDESSYRVLNLNNPFQETTTSYFHHSIGGYHPAKLRRYQELIDHRIAKEINSIVGSLQTAQTIEDVLPALSTCYSLNMLNTKYIILNPSHPPLQNPYAYGNAWFVPAVKIVENADEEIAALNIINPLTVAVVDKRFADQLEGFIPGIDSTATITLENYRPNRLTYKSKTSKEQLAVFSEIYYQPGWHATIDGKPADHFRADWTLRAMLVPAGEHTIEFEFYPKAYVTASYIASYSSFFILLLVLAVIGYSVWGAWKKREE